MELQALIREIHWLEWQLRAFEDKYSLLSYDFHQAFQAGELAEFDDVDLPQFHDFLEWAGLYEIWQRREQRYREFLQQRSPAEHLRYALVAA
ncbi:MAG: hypothetical protein WHX52_03700 [Anaerolineae bacterium]